MTKQTFEEVVISENPRTGVAGQISAGLKRYNESQIGEFEQVSLTFALYDKNKLIGGSVVAMYGNLCSIHLFWIAEDYRHRGAGSKILQAIENEAKSRKCNLIRLDTMEIQQAKGFYLKKGFTLRAEVPHGFCGKNHFIMDRIID